MPESEFQRLGQGASSVKVDLQWLTMPALQKLLDATPNLLVSISIRKFTSTGERRIEAGHAQIKGQLAETGETEPNVDLCRRFLPFALRVF